jgi:hypothetical protein
MSDFKGIADYVEWKAIKYSVGLWAAKHQVKVYGLEQVDTNASALFAVKHTRALEDLLIALHMLPRKTDIFVTERTFNNATQLMLRNQVARHLMRTAGLVPIYVALREKPSRLPATDARAFRKFYNTLNSGGWVAYAPEAMHIPNAVGEKIFPQMIMKAAKLGHRTYLVGIRYVDSIEVRIENYDARKKQTQEVIRDVRESFARLSGLENKLATAPAQLTPRK